MTNTTRSAALSLPTLEQSVIREALYQGRNAHHAGLHAYEARLALWSSLAAKAGWSAELRDRGMEALVDAYWATADQDDERAVRAVAAWQVEAGLA